VKYLVRAIKMAEAKKLAREALEMDDPKKIHAAFDAFYRARVKVE